jgi:ribose transport system permease protein
MTTLTSAPAAPRLSRATLGQFGVIGVVVAMVIIFGVVDPDFFGNFFHPNNVANIGRQTTLLLITAFAMTFIILSGEIDISIGAIASASSVVIALLISQGQPVLLAIAAGVGLGALLGLVNGVITVKGKIPSFIVTLGMLNLIQGFALAATNASTITLPNNPTVAGFRDLFARGAQTLPGGLIIPNPILFALGILLILVFILRRTKFGADVYAVGGNALSSRLAGIKVDQVKIGVFVLSGVLVALAAVIYTARLGNGQPLGMIGYELDAIAAVVIGGTSFTGGRGSLLRTVVGAFLIGILNNSLSLMGVSFVLQQVVSGVVIILAVLIDYWARRSTVQGT